MDLTSSSTAPVRKRPPEAKLGNACHPSTLQHSLSSDKRRHTESRKKNQDFYRVSLYLEHRLQNKICKEVWQRFGEPQSALFELMLPLERKVAYLASAKTSLGYLARSDGKARARLETNSPMPFLSWCLPVPTVEKQVWISHDPAWSGIKLLFAGTILGAVLHVSLFVELKLFRDESSCYTLYRACETISKAETGVRVHDGARWILLTTLNSATALQRQMYTSAGTLPP